MKGPSSLLPEHKKYIAKETAVGVVVNMVVSGVTTALTGVLGLHRLVDAPDVFVHALPMMVMSAFMGALVPSWLARRRHRGGGVRFLGATPPRTGRVLAVPVLLAAASMPPGMLAMHVVLAEIASGGMRPVGAFLLYLLYAGAIALVVTPAALVLLKWPRRGEAARDGSTTPALRIRGASKERQGHVPS